MILTALGIFIRLSRFAVSLLLEPAISSAEDIRQLIRDNDWETLEWMLSSESDLNRFVDSVRLYGRPYVDLGDYPSAFHSEIQHPPFDQWENVQYYDEISQYYGYYSYYTIDSPELKAFWFSKGRYVELGVIPNTIDFIIMRTYERPHYHKDYRVLTGRTSPPGSPSPAHFCDQFIINNYYPRAGQPPSTGGISMVRETGTFVTGPRRYLEHHKYRPQDLYNYDPAVWYSDARNLENYTSAPSYFNYTYAHSCEVSGQILNSVGTDLLGRATYQTSVPYRWMEYSNPVIPDFHVERIDGLTPFNLFGKLISPNISYQSGRRYDEDNNYTYEDFMSSYLVGDLPTSKWTVIPHDRPVKRCSFYTTDKLAEIYGFRKSKRPMELRYFLYEGSIFFPYLLSGNDPYYNMELLWSVRLKTFTIVGVQVDPADFTDELAVELFGHVIPPDWYHLYHQ